MEHFWIITLEVPGRASLTRQGVCDPQPGDTRAGLFDKVRAEIAQDFPDLATANTIFWSVEPNRF